MIIKKAFKYLFWLFIFVSFVSNNQVFADDTLASLSFHKKSVLRLAPLDDLGRPTGLRLYYRHFDAVTSTYSKSEDVKKQLPGYQEVAYQYADGSSKRSLYRINLLPKWFWLRGDLNNVRGYGLITQFTNIGYASDSWKDPRGRRYYEAKINNWLEEHPKYWVDYQIDLLYKDKELVPRQIRLTLSGLSKNGKIKKIALGGLATYDQKGVATVILDNIAPNATIDYLTGNSRGKSYEAQALNSDDRELEQYVYLKIDDYSGYYYDIPEEESPDDYYQLTEKEAIEQGYGPK